MLSLGKLTAALLAGAMFVLVAAQPAQAQAKRAPERKPKDFVGKADGRRDAQRLYRFESGAYKITTDVDKDLANDIAAHMDAVYQEFDARLRGFKPNPYAAVRPGEKMPLYVLRRYQDYLALLGGFGIDAANSGGIFFRTEKKESGLATWVEGQSRLRMYHVLQHEGFHQFADARIMFGLPPWVNEGLAEYFGDAVMVDRRLLVGRLDRARLQRMQRAVKNGDTLPFTTLMNMTNEAWLARVTGGDKGAALMYDTAWSVCYFLIHGGKAGKPLRTRVRGTDVGALEAYLLVLNDKFVRDPYTSPRAAAFKEVFSDNLKNFEDAWKAGLAKLEPDGWFTSVRHLQFVALGVRKLHQDDVTPKDWAELKQVMAKRRFRAVAPERDAAAKRDAKGAGKAGGGDGGDEPEPDGAAPTPQSYEFPDPAQVEVVPSEDPKLPPGLLVKNITPNIRLSWNLNTAGEIEEVITFSDPPKVVKRPEPQGRNGGAAAKPAAPQAPREIAPRTKP